MAARAIVFDLFITLTDFEAERRRPAQQAALAAVLGVDPEAFAALVRATFTERASGRMGDVRSTLVTLAGRLGAEIGSEQLDRAVELRHEQARQSLTPRAGVIEVIAGLRGDGYRIGILTDCTAEVVSLWPSLPYAPVVDAVTFSCEVGTRKPHPAGYRSIAARLGVDAEACVYVGDGSSSELSGAAAVGMKAVLLRTPLGPEFRYDAEPWAGPAIDGIGDVRPYL